MGYLEYHDDLSSPLLRSTTGLLPVKCFMRGLLYGLPID